MRSPARSWGRVALVLSAVLLALVTSACTGTAIHAAGPDGVDAAVGPAFARLYRLQQRELGHAVDVAVDRTAQCRRGRAHDRSEGAGDDWVCIVNFPYPDGHIEPVNYDLHVLPTGCYTAQGPSQVVGQQQQRDQSGRVVVNPLFEFDGCLTPS